MANRQLEKKKAIIAMFLDLKAALQQKYSNQSSEGAKVNREIGSESGEGNEKNEKQNKSRRKR